MIEKPFMYLSDLRRLILGSNLINDGFVVFGKSLENMFNLIVMFERLTKESKCIETRGNALNVLVDGHGAFVKKL